MSTNAKEVKKGQNVQKGVISYPWWFGGSSGMMAACITHPLDLIKVRLQTQSAGGPRKSMVGMGLHIVKHQGITGIYRGLSASLLRQMTYTMTRFAIYEGLKDAYTEKTKQKPPIPMLILLSSIGGFFGGVAGNAADVINVRMQNDASLPPEQRRNYKHAFDGLFRMIREEGIRSPFRAVMPNSARAAIMTAGQLSSYDTFKRLLLAHTPLTDGPITHFTASVLAALVATTVTSPIDVLKTRIMSQGGASKGFFAVMAETQKTEGFKWVFRGWVPSFLRLGPHTIATFIFFEQHKRVYRKLKGLEE